MSTIAEVVSRIRGQVKAEVQDAFVTDRYIYSLIEKFAQILMRRQDYANKLMKFNAVWKNLSYVELIEVDKVEAGCSGMSSGCIIKRSKHRLGTADTYCKLHRWLTRASSNSTRYVYIYD
jgi:hypothetical protein